MVTKESFISVCWRLIPYWLNNWEQQWGAECSSMMFELPHFALELLVVLPCVQVRCLFRHSMHPVCGQASTALPMPAVARSGAVLSCVQHLFSSQAPATHACGMGSLDSAHNMGWCQPLRFLPDSSPSAIPGNFLFTVRRTFAAIQAV